MGPLNLLLLSALVYALLLWHARRAPITIAAFVFGLGLAHHRTILFLAPAIALFVLLSDPSIVRRPREWARALFWLAFPLVLYLYIPIFGNAPPWYINTLEGFLNYVAGSEAGNYTRGNWLELGQAFVSILQYLSDSFGIVGIALIGTGATGVLKFNRAKAQLTNTRVALFLGLGALTYISFATIVSGEPDRYFVLPFVFLIYWFAFGVSAIQTWTVTLSETMGLAIPKTRFFWSLRTTAQATFALVLVLFIAFPFTDRFHIADWSTFDRVYKQWDEIFTLPIPQNATIVGNWGQLNAMRYLQRVEHRRPDMQAVGTLYDPAPQTEAARTAFTDGRTIFLAPGIVQPIGEYRYAQLGPLLEVRDAPQMQPPAAQKNIALNPSLTLANYEITTALEPYAPTVSIAPTRSARVTLDWQATGGVKDFLVRIRLYDPDGRAIAQRDEPPVRGLYAPSQWQRDEYVRDVHNVQIPGGTPPGTYQLKLQMLDAETQSPTSDEIAFAPLAVERATNLTRDQVFVQHPLDLALDDRIALWGYGGFEDTHRAGETISLNLMYFVREDVSMDLKLYLDLWNMKNRVRIWQVIPIAYYPTREWHKGEVLKAYYDWQLPDYLSPGEFSLSAGFLTSDLQSIGKIQIVP